MVKAGALKRKARAQARERGDDEFEFSLSDLENDRTPVNIDYTVDQLSTDGRRVLVDTGSVQIVADPLTSDPPATGASAADFFFHDLGEIDIDAVRTEGRKGPRDECRRRRYISSVSLRQCFCPIEQC